MSACCIPQKNIKQKDEIGRIGNGLPLTSSAGDGGGCPRFVQIEFPDDGNYSRIPRQTGLHIDHIRIPFKRLNEIIN